MKAVGRERVLTSLDFKPFDSDDITITTDQANKWTAAMTSSATTCGARLPVR